MENDIAYISGSNGLLILNVSIPNAPTLLGSNDTFDPNGLFVEGDLAYVGCRYYGMVIFNISNPTNPEFVGEYLHSSNQDYKDIFVSNTHKKEVEKL